MRVGDRVRITTHSQWCTRDDYGREGTIIERHEYLETETHYGLRFDKSGTARPVVASEIEVVEPEPTTLHDWLRENDAEVARLLNQAGTA